MSTRRPSARVWGAAMFGIFMTFAALPALAASDPAGAAPNAVAFAHISSSGSVVSFGGTKTTAASVKRVSAGDYQITFTGTYGPSANTGNMIPLSTAESGISAVSNAEVDSAGKKTLVIEVFTFDPSSESEEDNDCFVAVFHGK